VAKINLSRMDFETLVNLRQQVEERLHEHRSKLEEQLENLGRLVGCRKTGGFRKPTGQHVEREESCSEVSWSRGRDLGGSRSNTPLACCGDQRREEARQFLDRKVGWEGAEET
jgi:hypothetical protein